MFSAEQSTRSSLVSVAHIPFYKFHLPGRTAQWVDFIGRLRTYFNSLLICCRSCSSTAIQFIGSCTYVCISTELRTQRENIILFVAHSTTTKRNQSFWCWPLQHHCIDWLQGRTTIILAQKVTALYALCIIFDSLSCYNSVDRKRRNSHSST